MIVNRYVIYIASYIRYFATFLLFISSTIKIIIIEIFVFRDHNVVWMHVMEFRTPSQTHVVLSALLF